MSTNSVVAYLNEDGSVVSSYVHYDGYETGVGMMLLEHYNTDKCARDLASTLGYASSLSETVAESHADRAHTDEPETFESMEEFELYLMENSHLEFGYLWTGGKWMVASWTTEVIHAKPFTPEFGDAPRYESTWNGFSWLVTSFVRSGRKTVDRYRERALEDNREGRTEWDEYADELEVTVDKWHRYGMGEIASEAMAA